MAEIIRRYDDHKYQMPDMVINPFSNDPSKNPFLKLGWMTTDMNERSRARLMEFLMGKFGRQEGSYEAPMDPNQSAGENIFPSLVTNL